MVGFRPTDREANALRVSAPAPIIKIMSARLLLCARRGAAASVAAISAAAATKRESECEAKQPKLRVLITGFNDWKDDIEGNLWRCRDNPSCRLLVGAACETPPLQREGALVQALRRANVKADFTFQTLPVTWGTANGLDLMGFDVVVHLGLGVYDSHNTLVLEHGAFNLRGPGRDALQTPGADDVIEAGSQKHMKLDSAMLKRYADLRRQPIALTSSPSFTVSEVPSRKENTYICNEVRLASKGAAMHSSNASAHPHEAGCALLSLARARADALASPARRRSERGECRSTAQGRLLYPHPVRAPVARGRLR